MNTVAGTKPMRVGRLKRLLRSLGAVTGVLAIGARASAASAQDTGYRSATTAPAAWQAFARELQVHFEQRLAVDDKDVRALRVDLAARSTGADAAPLTFVARAWVQSDGKVERVEFDGLVDTTIAAQLRTLLRSVAVGAPPPDILQPLRLRLSLRPGEQPAQDK
jgi:hypothetical protein